ncbi:MAG: AMP-binding protein, partial [Polyangiaceae bacterium]
LLERVLEVWSDLGCVQWVVGLDPRLDVAKALEGAKFKGKTVPTLEDAKAKFVSWTDAIARGEASDAKDPAAFMRTMEAISLDAPGLMLYTSGTSGNPKGVPLTHRNVGVNGRDWYESNAPLLEGDAEQTDLLWLPMSHIFGLGEMCLGNTLGFTTYLCDPASVLTRLPEVRPTVFMSVPSHWEKIAILAAKDGAGNAAKRIAAVTGGRLKFCLSGGAGLKREVKELFHEAGVLIIEGYGLTECSPTLTLNRPDAYRFDTVGKPFPSVELKLAEDGEILAKGPSIFLGYHKDPEATREAFTEDGWFKTGDVGRFTEDGFLQIIDRKKDILVTAGGKNVPPANIEVRFRDDQLIAHVVVYGEAQRYLVAGVWLHEGKVLSEETQALIQKSVDAVNGQLPSYETIKKFVVIDTPLSVEAGLLTASLKVRRKKVYEAFGAKFEALYREGDTRAGAAP